MKTTKRSILLALLPLLGAMLTQTKLNAQGKNANNDNKYEIAVDLQNFFSDGFPEKVLFKINNFKENQVKGAYRFGIGTSYYKSKDVTTIIENNENLELIQKIENSGLLILLGYEFQKDLNNAIFYYGIDLSTLLNYWDYSNYSDIGYTNNLFFVPFAGIKIFLTNNLSLAFEAGIENNFMWSKPEKGNNVNADNHSSLFQSHINLPYSLTFNFDF